MGQPRVREIHNPYSSRPVHEGGTQPSCLVGLLWFVLWRLRVLPRSIKNHCIKHFILGIINIRKTFENVLVWRSYFSRIFDPMQHPFVTHSASYNLFGNTFLYTEKYIRLSTNMIDIWGNQFWTKSLVSLLAYPKAPKFIK